MRNSTVTAVVLCVLASVMTSVHAQDRVERDDRAVEPASDGAPREPPTRERLASEVGHEGHDSLDVAEREQTARTVDGAHREIALELARRMAPFSLTWGE